MNKPNSKPHTTRFVGTIQLGKREATLDVICTITFPPNMTPREKAKLERFNLATALTTMRAVPSGRVDAILASVKAKLDATTVSDYLKPAEDAPPKRGTKAVSARKR